MTTTNILSMLGGLALFLYGMQMMGDGLEAAAGNKMKQILEKLTSNRIKGVIVGALITAIIQSSSATTVMVVGFVNTGLMTLQQAVWIIMGANIGTTITGQLIALDIGAIAPLIAFLGVACIMFVKNERVRHIAAIFAGLGILFVGMDMMSAAMYPLRESEAFINLMTTIDNPLLCIAIGAVFTALIQSSSASVGILQALASTGLVPFSTAVFILFGQNIGTCITAVLAAIGTKTNAKRTTVIHLLFNVIGTTIFTVVCLVTPFIGLLETLTSNPVQQIANMHTTFNLVTSLLLLPFGTLLAKAATKILPEKAEEMEEIQQLHYIVPFERNYHVGHSAVILTQIEQEVSRMFDKAKQNLTAAYDALLKKDISQLEAINAREEYIDYLNTEISKYIVGLMSTEMSQEDTKAINAYYMLVSNIERIGDHAMNIAEYAEDLKKWDISFSDYAVSEIVEMKNANETILEGINLCDHETVAAQLAHVIKHETIINQMQKEYLEGQIIRAKNGMCKAESGILFSELLTDFERVGDYAKNIAELHIQMN